MTDTFLRHPLPDDFLHAGLPGIIINPPDYADRNFKLLDLGKWCKYACNYLEPSYVVTFWACEALPAVKCPVEGCPLIRFKNKRAKEVAKLRRSHD